MLDFQKQTPKNEYTREQLLELRHEETFDMVEKAKNMKIAERIIQKNAAKRLTVPKDGPNKIVAANQQKHKEPNADDFWSKATTSNQNAAATAANRKDNPADGYQLANPWAKSNLDDPTGFSFGAKVGSWLRTGQDFPTQFSCGDDIPIEPSIERKRSETSSLVSDMSSKSALRSKLLDKTAKLKQTLSNLKQQNN